MTKTRKFELIFGIASGVLGLGAAALLSSFFGGIIAIAMAVSCCLLTLATYIHVTDRWASADVLLRISFFLVFIVYVPLFWFGIFVSLLAGPLFELLVVSPAIAAMATWLAMRQVDRQEAASLPRVVP